MALFQMQLTRGNPGKKYGTREQEVADVSMELKALAMELGIPVTALSQLKPNCRVLATGKKTR